MAMAGAGGMGGGLTINVYGDVNDAEAFYRKVNEARLEFERQGQLMASVTVTLPSIVLIE